MYNLYLVEHPIRTFIGVAKTLEIAREHYGTLPKITLIEDEAIILEMRLEKPETIFLAI